MSTYVSRFATVSEAITYAEANGQGTLTLNPDGSIFNSNGQVMGYDSDGNLAPQGPAPGPVAPIPVPVPEAVVAVPLPKPSGAFGRFLSVSAAIDYAVANGQGTLSVQFDGTVTNESGQIMVYDSSGNLAPSAAVFEPVAGVIGGIVPDPVADAAVEITAVSNTVKIPKVGSAEYKALLLETGRTDLIGFNYAAHLSATKEVNTAVPAEKTSYVSRFATVAKAIEYAEANGQGAMTLNADGSIVNSNGEVMGYDSAGNLAPSVAVYEPVAGVIGGIVPDPVPVPVEQTSYVSRFATVAEAIEYAEANGQGTMILNDDGSIVNESGSVMRYDSEGNLSPRGRATVADVAVEVAPVSNTVKIPKVGSAEYKVLLLETGRTDLIGFNYAAHLSVKKEVNTEALDIYLEAETGIALLGQLDSVDINALFATASPTQILELTTKFADDQAFQAFLASETTPVAPEEGSAEYDQLLEDTGKADLTDFDYEDFVFSKTNAEQALIRAGLDKKFGNIKVRSGTNPESVFQNDTTPLALIGSTGSDKVVGGLGNDVLISSGGEDVLEGGAGVDSVIMSTSAAKSQIVRDSVSNNWVVTGDSGSDTLVDVERVMFDDSSLALDVGKDEIGGKAALLLGALLGRDAINNPAYVGTVIGLLDGGMSIDELAAVAIESLSLTSDEALITTLWENLLGVGPTESEKASVIELLDNGLTQVELILLAADSEINESNIDLIGIAQTGLSYSVDIGG